MLELQAHGGPVVLQLLLARCLEAGAERDEATGRERLPHLRIANPGEFTERAFLNDKLDLAQAEAVADLIDASTEAAARSAARSLDGAFSSEIDALAAALVELRLLVEATLDFPEEEIDFLVSADALGRLQRATAGVDAVLLRARQGALLRDGIRVVLAGQPNVGKSSLLNALAGAELAIVTATPGTTRDKVAQTIQIEGVPVHVVDTAGLRDAVDEVERIGVARTWAEIEGADAIVFLHDLTRLGEAGYEAGDAAIAARLPAGAGRTQGACSTSSTSSTCSALRPSTRAWSSRRSPAKASTPCARACSSSPAGRRRPRASSSPAPATSTRCNARAGTSSSRRRMPSAATPPSSSSPKSCASPTTRSARSPARSRPTICSAPSSGASASASDPAPRGKKRRAGRATRQMDGRAAPAVAGRKPRSR